MPPSIQVAFQGGGARFVEMLPIAHALADAHRNKTIQIKRVAGSSAGSICAALIASGADFKKARAFIVKDGLTSAQTMRRWSTNFGHGTWSDRARLAMALLLAQRGVPLLRTEILMDFLNDLFAEATTGNPMLIETINSRPDGIKLAITGSDLSRSQGALFESGNLIDTIAHSSAIPFAFRTYTDVKTSPYVDGGLCENLPVERLLADEDSDGRIFCVSIVEQKDQKDEKEQKDEKDEKELKDEKEQKDRKGQRYIPKNVKDYCLQLISASMNHNVERAKRLVGHSNVIEATTELDTFDFEGAVRKLKNNKFYKESYDKTQDRMHHFAQLHSIAPAPSPSFLSGRVSAPMIMRSLFRVFETSLGKPEWIYKKAAFVVRADGLKATPPDRTKAADYVIRIATIQAKGNNLVCFNSSAMLDAERSIMPTSWTCYNETKAIELPVQAIPVGNVKPPGKDNMIGVLVFFEDPVQSIDAGDIVTIRSHYLVDGGMEGLNLGSDYIATSNPQQIPIERTDVVLAYPSSFGAVAAVADTSAGARPGTLIENKQLQVEYASVTTTGYDFVGLTTKNLLPGQRFRGIFAKV
jgi:predicted acylesterase/phospholipase RssA